MRVFCEHYYLSLVNSSIINIIYSPLVLFSMLPNNLQLI